jgi:hypothetical protein
LLKGSHIRNGKVILSGFRFLRISFLKSAGLLSDKAQSNSFDCSREGDEGAG